MIYIVEDDENIGQMECYALKNSGFGTELFEDSESFFSAVARRLPTLVILDLMLPGNFAPTEGLRRNKKDSDNNCECKVRRSGCGTRAGQRSR